MNESMLTDDDLTLLCHDVPDPSMVIFEDIDDTRCAEWKSQVKIENVESEVVGEISLPGLLNALDGMAADGGIILIMTTDHPEKCWSKMRPHLLLC